MARSGQILAALKQSRLFLAWYKDSPGFAEIVKASWKHSVVFVVTFAQESSTKEVMEKPLLLTLLVETKGSGCVLTNKAIDLSEFFESRIPVERTIAMSLGSNGPTLRGAMCLVLFLPILSYLPFQLLSMQNGLTQKSMDLLAWMQRRTSLRVPKTRK